MSVAGVRVVEFGTKGAGALDLLISLNKFCVD